LSCKPGLFWLSGFWGFFCLIWTHPIFAFFVFLHFEEDLALYLNNLKCPLPTNDLHQVWLKLDCWLWGRRFKNLLFCHYLPLEKGAPSFKQFWIPFPQDDFYQVLLKVAPRFWKRSQNWKVFQTEEQTDGRTDKRTNGPRTMGDPKPHFSFQGM
jgi:hypothetical protein